MTAGNFENAKMNILIKIVLTIIIVLAITYPYINPAEEVSILDRVFSIGLTGSLILAVIFLTAVAFYCRTLQKCLELIHPDCRAASPKSVWFMFLIPFNIIEDFFIVLNISNSIQAEARQNTSLLTLKEFGTVSGLGWCIAQVLSFIPNYVGQISGFVGLILWILHWNFITKVNKLLVEKK